MPIWACYTEVESEPSFVGYVNTKKEALEWVKETTEFDYPDSNMELSVEYNHIQSDNGYHHIIAVKLKRIT